MRTVHVFVLENRHTAVELLVGLRQHWPRLMFQVLYLQQAAYHDDNVTVGTIT